MAHFSDLLVLLADPAAEWMADGLCVEVGGDVFFPEKGGLQRAPKAVCRRCGVREECLEWALAHGERGIWGGLNEVEREQLRVRQQAA